MSEPQAAQTITKLMKPKNVSLLFGSPSTVLMTTTQKVHAIVAPTYNRIFAPIVMLEPYSPI